jgi:hypothetical protein
MLKASEGYNMKKRILLSSICIGLLLGSNLYAISTKGKPFLLKVEKASKQTLEADNMAAQNLKILTIADKKEIAAAYEKRKAQLAAEAAGGGAPAPVVTPPAGGGAAAGETEAQKSTKLVKAMNDFSANLTKFLQDAYAKGGDVKATAVKIGQAAQAAASAA